ncbi:XRE family transcriptional regulator [Pseudomonas putida S11]|nr:XRE family transcriptional regulator [Pseudomonas putida S11]
MDVGERLQAIRKLKGLSQRELAKRAGVTNSTISMIEKNSVSPSISSLRKVLSGIPMSMVEFFSVELEPESPTQIVYKAHELIDISDGAVTMKLVGKSPPQPCHRPFSPRCIHRVPTPAPKCLPMTVKKPASCSKAAWSWWSATRSSSLKEGDSYYFESTRPHRFRNPFDRPARLISAATPSNF